MRGYCWWQCADEWVCFHYCTCLFSTTALQTWGQQSLPCPQHCASPPKLPSQKDHWLQHRLSPGSPWPWCCLLDWYSQEGGSMGWKTKTWQFLNTSMSNTILYSQKEYKLKRKVHKTFFKKSAIPDLISLTTIYAFIVLMLKSHKEHYWRRVAIAEQPPLPQS